MENERVYDISRRIAPEVAVYPGDDPLGAAQVCEVGPEAPCNITSLTGWTTHFLTHVDPPKHFVKGGATLDEISLSRFMGDAVVIQVEADAVGSEHVRADLTGKNVLFKTRNSSASETSFDENHVYIAEDAVLELIAAKPNLVGIDYMSVDRFGDEEYPAHRGLLGNDILVLEGLDLTGVAPGDYYLIAMPLKIQDADGSPVRAVLVDRRT